MESDSTQLDDMEHRTAHSGLHPSLEKVQARLARLLVRDDPDRQAGTSTGDSADGPPIRDRALADRTISESVSIVSHELRTPLSAIIGSLKIIQGGAVGHMPPQMAPMIDMAQRNALRMLGLIDDILEAQRIGAGNLKIDRQPIDLNDLVRESVDANRSLAAAKELILNLRTGDVPVRVLADPRRLEQVMANLISNAVKFSDHGGTVEIDVGLSDAGARVTVHDTGPGIPPDFQPRIFDKHARRDLADGRNQGGSGLGLSISKALVEAHSGQIGFSSEPRDTRFWIELPLLAATADESRRRAC